MSPQKTVLITGCSAGGIGNALAKEYHARGLRVFATARKMEAMEDLATLPGIERLLLDVTSVESIKRTRDEVARLTGGKLDILINNAGKSYSVPATDVNMDEVRAMFDVNLFGVMSMVQHFVHLLIASGEGRIVNIGSIAGVMPYVFGSSYNASKAALHAYGDTLRLELAPFNVKVVTIVTGGVRSQIARVDRRLPADSLFQPINEDYLQRVGNSQKNPMETADYARAVVSHTLKRSLSAWYWQGYFSWWCWFISTFGWRTAFDGPISRKFGLTKLAAILRGRGKKD